MPRIFWDASALAKRYCAEAGTDSVNAIFAVLLLSAMATTLLSAAETFAILCRKRNGGALSAGDFVGSAGALHREITSHPDITMLEVEDTDILASFAHIERHNINATDALLLTILLRERANATPYVLVSSDVRLIRAATAEGVACVNPEAVAPTEVSTLLAAL